MQKVFVVFGVSLTEGFPKIITEHVRGLTEGLCKILTEGLCKILTEGLCKVAYGRLV